MTSALILSTARTPFAKSWKGAFNMTHGATLGAHALNAAVQRGQPYDLVVLDPPSFQKGSFVATKDYARLMRRLPELLAPGGEALLCLNAPELDSSFLSEQMRELAPTLRFIERLPNPPAFQDIAPERALKVLRYRAPD